ncbi:circumsporozoite protein-like [Hydractinia symbiolongicarpus]|uniref:circumsporozoite protein-like n=1 Tax=Hydractinia symbiolongicarpus TaxID=13093 RepID=UPI00254B2BE3|nr:circumsporozoite protein-like [Hydractinia symbiolongicarpus]
MQAFLLIFFIYFITINNEICYAGAKPRKSKNNENDIPEETGSSELKVPGPGKGPSLPTLKINPKASEPTDPSETPNTPEEADGDNNEPSLPSLKENANPSVPTDPSATPNTPGQEDGSGNDQSLPSLKGNEKPSEPTDPPATLNTPEKEEQDESETNLSDAQQSPQNIQKEEHSDSYAKYMVRLPVTISAFVATLHCYFLY